MPLTVWRIFDGKIGHNLQSHGLSLAISRLKHCEILDFQTPPLSVTISGLLSRKFPPGDDLPPPDFIIGTGHQTHLPVICAKLARGGISIVLMNPSLPYSWFDVCLIPEHDKPRHRKNIIRTVGALTTIHPTLKKKYDQGLLLIGGPSKHFSWDEKKLVEKIKNIAIKTPINWILTDSPRTPISVRKLLEDINLDNLKYIPFSQTSRKWLENQLLTCSTIWVTEESISMVSEALSSGAAVGLLPMYARHKSRVYRAIKDFCDSNLATTYKAWEAGDPVLPPKNSLNESERCARILLQRFVSQNNPL